nr:daple-like protein [Leptinotarsa decemlineata]
MGNQQVKPEEKLKYINLEVNSLRASFRRTRSRITKTGQEEHYRHLVRYSKEVSALKGKVKEKHLTKTQENISNTVTEVLSTPVHERESILDSAAIETNSIIEVPKNRRRSSSKTIPINFSPIKKSISSQNMSRHVSTLEDIDLKFKSLKPQIKTAIENKDSTQLRVHKKTIEVLATDLEMIEISEDTPLGDRKEKLVSSLTSQYQKINSAMKEIRRSKDIEFLYEQNNNTLVRKLEEIRKELGKTDASLKEAIKGNDPSSVKAAQEDLVRINQRLSSIEVIDENTKNIKMQIVDQITWLYKYMNDSTKKGSQSDLTKAQVTYEELIKNIASGKTKNKDDIKGKLESLQSFVNTIDDVDESEEKKKKQLLININDSVSSLTGTEKKELNSEREDKSILKKKTSVDILKEVKQFCDSVEKTIKLVKFTEQEFNNLMTILGNAVRSIETSRENISPVKPKLNKVLNYSSPDLTTSNKSQNDFKSKSNTFENVKKAEKGASDLVTSKEKMKKEQGKLDKTMKRETHHIRDENCFSVVDQIRTQVNYIKEKIGEIEDDTHVRNKLASFRKTLQAYFNHNNQTIANNAKIVSLDIQKLLTNISNSQDLKQVYSFGKIETIHECFEHMKKVVEEFFDKKESDAFEMIIKQLLACKQYLTENKNITGEQKDEISKKLRYLMKVMEKKASIQETLTALKEKVNRFSGAYKGVLYNKIEKDLNKIIIDASEHIDNKTISDEVTRQAEKHLKILEHRATRDQSFRRAISERPIAIDDEKIMKLRAEVENIRNDMEIVAGNDVDSFMHLKSRLDLVILELDQLKKLNENEEQMKTSIQNEVDALKIIVDAKISTALENRNILLMKKDEASEGKYTERLDKIERGLDELRSEIENFVGTTSDNKFYELDECAIRIILKINDMGTFPEGGELYNKKVKLSEEAMHCSKMLSQRANETEELINFERRISDIENNFDHYTKSTKDLEKLAEHIEIVKRDLQKTNFNKNLRERKQSCVEQIDNVVKKIDERNDNEKVEATDSKTSMNIENATEKQIKTTTEDKVHQQVMNEKQSKDTYIGSTAFLKDIERNKIGKITTEEQELDRIEEQTEKIIGKIAVFDNSDTSEEYQQLEDDILKLNVKLNLLNIKKEDVLDDRKKDVEQKISNCLDYLDKRMQALEIISSIENELEIVNKKIKKCSTKEENNKLNEKLIELQVKLGRVQLDDEPNKRKMLCHKKIKNYLIKLKEGTNIIHDTTI